MNTIKIFAPASVANVSCGYDIFGFALNDIGDEITLTKRDDGRLVIQKVEGADLPTEPEKNVATVGIASLLKHIGSKQGFDISIKKTIPPCSGLGSSASSASGAVFAASELLQTGLSKHELLPFAMDGEYIASKSYHADNIAPAMLGGFTVVRSVDPKVDVFNIDYPKDLHVLVIFPQVPIKTAEAKELLGDAVSMKQARVQWGNVAGMVAGMMTKDWELIERSMVDVVAEPLRKKLIPNYDEVKTTALEQGAVAFNISGSGPSMFAFFKSEGQAKQAIPIIEKTYNRQSIDCLFHISNINSEGAKVL